MLDTIPTTGTTPTAAAPATIAPAAVDVPVTPLPAVAPATAVSTPAAPVAATAADGSASTLVTGTETAPATTTTTAPADTAATANSSTKDAAIVAAAPKADVPASATPVTVTPTAPAADAAASTGTRADTGAKKDHGQGSDAAQQPVTPAVVPSSAADGVQAATATAPVDATQAPSMIVPAAVPTAVVPVAGVSALPQSLTIDRERFVRLVDGLEARLRVSGAEGGKAMRMTLRPTELGDVTVRLQIAADGQSATATLLAQNHQTGDLLAQAAGDLRQALSDRGLRLDRLEVTAGSLTGDTTRDGAPSGTANPDKDTRRSHYAFDARTDLIADTSKAGETAQPTSAHEGLYVLA